MPYTLEVCVDSVASALAAKRGGADRLELCADLIIGGTTPSLALVRQVKAETGLPVRALLRPRFGDFCYDRYELAQMAETAASGGCRKLLLGPRPAGCECNCTKQTLGAATRTHLRGESPPACGGYFTLSRNRTKPARPGSSSL